MDGLGRVVSSGGTLVRVWRVKTSPKAGFTKISSNGTNNPIIWALSRPVASSTTNQSSIYLMAFYPDSGKNNNIMKRLFKATAGQWPNLGVNSNLVPVVANGQVFVASYKQLQVFGLTPPKHQKTAKKK